MIRQRIKSALPRTHALKLADLIATLNSHLNFLKTTNEELTDLLRYCKVHEYAGIVAMMADDTIWEELGF